MLSSYDFATLAVVAAGAFFAGFTTGFAGFGTGLVASGLWFHALPAGMVPPLVALTSVAAQIVGLVTVRKSFNWPQTAPYLAGAMIGVPIGVAALAAASPFILRTLIGAFLRQRNVQALELTQGHRTCKHLAQGADQQSSLLGKQQCLQTFDRILYRQLVRVKCAAQVPVGVEGPENLCQ